MGIKEKLESLARNSIKLKISGRETYKRGASRFGGQPDVPPDFVWPTYEGENYENITKNRPLSFLVQLNCEELARYDTEHLLPNHGLLSFFYETDTQCWGYDPQDNGCARVYWFEDISVLSAADFPEDMEEYFRFPMIQIKLSQGISYPCWEDFFAMLCSKKENYTYDTQWDKIKVEWEKFDEIWYELTGTDTEEPEGRSQLLGWPDVIQNSMYEECDLVTQGYTMNTPEELKKIPEEIRKRAEETSHDRWMLLFQLDTVECDDFELMFGDCGHIYFCITKEDLAARRFDRIWLVSQCY